MGCLGILSFREIRANLDNLTPAIAFAPKRGTVTPAARSKSWEAASMQPDTHYAKCGELHIAYQIFGEGSVNLAIRSPGRDDIRKSINASGEYRSCRGKVPATPNRDLSKVPYFPAKVASSQFLNCDDRERPLWVDSRRWPGGRQPSANGAIVQIGGIHYRS